MSSKSSEVKLGTMLYANGRGDTIHCCKAAHVGMELTDPAVFSKYRSAGAPPRAMISLVALVIDAFLTGTPEIAVATFSDGICMESGGSVYYTDGKKVVSENRNFLHICASLFTYAMHHCKNAELQTTMKQCITAYNASGQVPANLLALACDSFYYSFFKQNPSVTLEIAEHEEIVARMRTETLHALREYEGSGVTKQFSFAATNEVKKTTLPKQDLSDLLESCKKGDYVVDYKWSESQEDYRQGLNTLNGFIPSEEFRSILTKIKFRSDRILSRLNGLDLTNGQDRVAAIGNDYINLTLCGKPGTGKTKLGYALAAATGMPVYTIACSHNTDEDEFVGMTKMIDGVAQSVPTDTVKCVEEGGILLLEEANLPQAAVMMGALGQLVEFPFILKKFGYQPIRRHPLCIIITTMNTGTAGSKLMSQPFANRFKQSFELNDPAKEDFIRILMNTGADRTVCRWVYDCYERIVACVEDENGIADSESILLSLSMRTCIGAIENIQEGMEPRDAVKNSIIGKIAEQDQEVASICAKVLDSMRDPEF